jgi:hypothetical protein
MSEEQGEVDKFRKWDLDIAPHRRLMKEGIDLPESMRSMPEYRNLQTMGWMTPSGRRSSCSLCCSISCVPAVVRRWDSGPNRPVFSLRRMTVLLES